MDKKNENEEETAGYLVFLRGMDFMDFGNPRPTIRTIYASDGSHRAKPSYHSYFVAFFVLAGYRWS